VTTLTVVVTVLPSTPYTNVGLTVDAWLASTFVRNPSGQALPAGASPVATAVTGAGGVATLAGLTSPDPYWIRVIDQLGYYHWFFANWEANPLFANVNMPTPNFMVGGGAGPVSAHGELVFYSWIQNGDTNFNGSPQDIPYTDVQYDPLSGADGSGGYNWPASLNGLNAFIVANLHVNGSTAGAGGGSYIIIKKNISIPLAIRYREIWAATTGIIDSWDIAGVGVGLDTGDNISIQAEGPSAGSLSWGAVSGSVFPSQLLIFAC
jgi:hypothetical protein